MNKLTTAALKKKCNQLRNTEQAHIQRRFFKTAPGEYGHGDKFMGIKVPILRKIAKEYQEFSIQQITELLDSAWHEHRFIALCMLIHNYKKSKTKSQKNTVYRCYINNMDRVNNWDLVDISAPHIIGEHLIHSSPKILYRWATHNNLWYRRIAIVSTFAFIRQQMFSDTLNIAEILFKDAEPLLHKAAGWMLREVGKRQQHTLSHFLQQHAAIMPRTMLRYAIEKYPKNIRNNYLKQKLIIA